jgi:ethanolamine utilization protein EutN
MQLAKVVGHAVSSVKHATMVGWKLLLTQPLTTDGRPDGEPQLVIDSLGADGKSLVLISNDGKGARELMKAPNSPVRWFVMGIVD